MQPIGIMRKQPTNGAICLSKCQQSGLVEMQLQKNFVSSWETDCCARGLLMPGELGDCAMKR